MKKTTCIFKLIMAIAVVTVFAACTKVIEQPPNAFNDSYKQIPTMRPVNPPDYPTTDRRTSIGYAGTSTLGDSTKAKN